MPIVNKIGPILYKSGPIFDVKNKLSEEGVGAVLVGVAF